MGGGADGGGGTGRKERPGGEGNFLENTFFLTWAP